MGNNVGVGAFLGVGLGDGVDVVVCLVDGVCVRCGCVCSCCYGC